MLDQALYDDAGFPLDKSYLECGLPAFLQTSLDQMKETWKKLDAGEIDLRWDCYWCELNADINACEVEHSITEEQAWYLRENYLRIERPGEII